MSNHTDDPNCDCLDCSVICDDRTGKVDAVINFGSGQTYPIQLTAVSGAFIPGIHSESWTMHLHQDYSDPKPEDKQRALQNLMLAIAEDVRKAKDLAEELGVKFTVIGATWDPEEECWSRKNRWSSDDYLEWSDSGGCIEFG